MKRLRHFFACLAALCAATAAYAHKSSDAYLSWRIDGEFIEQRLDIALRDLDRELALDANGDGQLSWGEVRQRWSDIQQLADQGLQLRADGQPCRVLQTEAPMLDEHSDGAHAVLQQRAQCPAAVRTLSVDYRLFAASDATHRGLARVRWGTQERSLVLVPGAPPLGLPLGGPDAPGGPQAPAGAADGDAPQGFFGFVAEGMHHIAIGADHVAFLVTLLMVAVWRRQGPGWVARAQARAAWAETLKLVSAFTVAHSLTLALATLGVLAPPSRWVESLIAISVLVAALDNLRPFVRGPRWVMVSVFGLVHGFGFAGPLQALGLQQGNLALPLLGFNLGVELGQLAIVALLLPLACALRAAPAYRWSVRGGSVAIAGVAAVWVLERGLDVSLLP